jgi:hypothetical protein
MAVGDAQQARVARIEARINAPMGKRQRPTAWSAGRR